MVQELYTKQFIYFSLMKISCSPYMGDRFYFRIIPVKFCPYYDVMPVLRRRQVVDHRQVCLPIDAGKAKKIVEEQGAVLAKLLSSRQPIFWFNIDIDPFASFFESSGRKQFS